MISSHIIRREKKFWDNLFYVTPEFEEYLEQTRHEIEKDRQEGNLISRFLI